MIQEITVMTLPPLAVILFALLVMPHLLRAMRAPARPKKLKVIDVPFEVVPKLTRVNIIA